MNCARGCQVSCVVTGTIAPVKGRLPRDSRFVLIHLWRLLILDVHHVLEPLGCQQGNRWHEVCLMEWRECVCLSVVMTITLWYNALSRFWTGIISSPLFVRNHGSVHFHLVFNSFPGQRSVNSVRNHFLHHWHWNRNQKSIRSSFSFFLYFFLSFFFSISFFLPLNCLLPLDSHSWTGWRSPELKVLQHSAVHVREERKEIKKIAERGELCSQSLERKSFFHLLFLFLSFFTFFSFFLLLSFSQLSSSSTFLLQEGNCQTRKIPWRNFLRCFGVMMIMTVGGYGSSITIMSQENDFVPKNLMLCPFIRLMPSFVSFLTKQRREKERNTFHEEKGFRSLFPLIGPVISFSHFFLSFSHLFLLPLTFTFSRKRETCNLLSFHIFPPFKKERERERREWKKREKQLRASRSGQVLHFDGEHNKKELLEILFALFSLFLSQTQVEKQWEKKERVKVDAIITITFFFTTIFNPLSFSKRFFPASSYSLHSHRGDQSSFSLSLLSVWIVLLPVIAGTKWAARQLLIVRTRTRGDENGAAGIRSGVGKLILGWIFERREERRRVMERWANRGKKKRKRERKKERKKEKQGDREQEGWGQNPWRKKMFRKKGERIFLRIFPLHHFYSWSLLSGSSAFLSLLSFFFLFFLFPSELCGSTRNRRKREREREGGGGFC